MYIWDSTKDTLKCDVMIIRGHLYMAGPTNLYIISLLTHCDCSTSELPHGDDIIYILMSHFSFHRPIKYTESFQEGES